MYCYTYVYVRTCISISIWSFSTILLQMEYRNWETRSNNRGLILFDKKSPTWNICSWSCIHVLYVWYLRKLTSKISKPAISSTPMKCCLFCCVSRVSLHFLTNHLNSLSNMAFDMAPTEYATWSLLRPCVTNSLPTLILGFNKFL